MTSPWIAVDWGTTHLRAYRVAPDGTVADRASSPEGMGKLARDGFEPALLRLIEPWLPAEGSVEVLACGMVGSRQGWIEAPYRTVPCTPVDGGSLIAVPVKDPRLAVRIVPGLCRMTPADVMRGEETQIAGALALMPGYDGILCLPGTHSKWVHVSAGEVVSFQTYMTGELFALISEQSVLRHGMAGDGFDEAAFDAGCETAFGRPQAFAAALFALRAEGLLADLTPAAARSRLSGLLIGLELAGSRPYWLGQKVTLIGSEALSARYARALSREGTTARPIAAEEATIAGLVAARTQHRVVL